MNSSSHPAFYPEGVELKPLGEVATFKRGQTISEKKAKSGSIPVIKGGQKPAYYVDSPNFTGECCTVSGSGAYSGFVSYWNEPIFLSGAFAAIPNENTMLTKYVFYFLKNMQEKIYSMQTGAGVPHIYPHHLQPIPIPIPPLSIQKRIVEILDKFTELITELKLRKKQYTYYLNQLLDFGTPENPREGVEFKRLGEIAEFRRGSFPQPYTNKAWYGGEGAMPFVQVADVGSMRLAENTKQTISKVAQKSSVFVPKGTVIVTLQGTIGRVAVTQYDSFVDRTILIFETYKIEINKKYFSYAIAKKFEVEAELARGSTLKTITKEELKDFQIPIPPLETQKRIVEILDKFESLTTDLTQGIPAEIQKREKQYAYYRDWLLSF